jgi:hypothetical protein
LSYGTPLATRNDKDFKGLAGHPGLSLIMRRPDNRAWKSPVNWNFLERVTRIELALSAWE